MAQALGIAPESAAGKQLDASLATDLLRMTLRGYLSRKELKDGATAIGLAGILPELLPELFGGWMTRPMIPILMRNLYEVDVGEGDPPLIAQLAGTGARRKIETMIAI